ncbi:hypothetical protein D7X74_28060 [Corallococcus sp. CA047B]|nr:hypothetical protein D7X74_28060 [Corallococcus sp. CA047B]
MKQCVRHRKDEPLPAGKTYDCDCEAECTGCYEDPAMSSQANVIKHQSEGGEFIQGPWRIPRPSCAARPMSPAPANPG